MTRSMIRAAGAALLAMSLSGCIDSAGPILRDAQPLFGERLHLQFYTLRKGFAEEPEQATFKWDGARYAHADGAMSDVSAFTVHPLKDGVFIIQSVPANHPKIVEYAVMHKLTTGVYQVIGIDEDDAGARARAANCKRVEDSRCRVETREQLYVFARATAARRKGEGGLVIRLADEASH